MKSLRKFMEKYNACETDEERFQIMRSEIKDIQFNLERINKEQEVLKREYDSIGVNKVGKLCVEIEFDYNTWLNDSLELIPEYVTVKGIKDKDGKE